MQRSPENQQLEAVAFYTESIKVTLELPDELANVIADQEQDLSRAAFEAVTLEAYREHKLTTAQAQRILGFESRYDFDGFLKQHQVWLEYSLEDFEADRETHRMLGL